MDIRRRVYLDLMKKTNYWSRKYGARIENAGREIVFLIRIRLPICASWATLKRWQGCFSPNIFSDGPQTDFHPWCNSSLTIVAMGLFNFGNNLLDPLTCKQSSPFTSPLPVIPCQHLTFTFSFTYTPKSVSGLPFRQQSSSFVLPPSGCFKVQVEWVQQKVKVNVDAGNHTYLYYAMHYIYNEVPKESDVFGPAEQLRYLACRLTCDI